MTWKPCVVVRFPLGDAPRVKIESQREDDTARLLDWIVARPEWNALGQRAHELAEEASAA